MYRCCFWSNSFPMQAPWAHMRGDADKLSFFFFFFSSSSFEAVAIARACMRTFGGRVKLLESLLTSNRQSTVRVVSSKTQSIESQPPAWLIIMHATLYRKTTWNKWKWVNQEGTNLKDRIHDSRWNMESYILTYCSRKERTFDSSELLAEKSLSFSFCSNTLRASLKLRFLRQRSSPELCGGYLIANCDIMHDWPCWFSE